jgi:DNA-binding transcriptional LysR family regulator
MHKRIDWTDLQFVLALARSKSLAAAARGLGVSHTTVLRRVAALEESQGVRLFERLRTGYALTAGGEEMLAAAHAVSEVVTDLERKLAGRDRRLEGLVRLATIDTVAASLLPLILGKFHAEHPAVTVDLTVSATLADLTHREADVAIRVSNHPPEGLIGRRICKVGLGIYRARQTGEAPLPHEDLPAQRWIGPSQALAATNVARWMRERVDDSQVILRVDSIVGMAEAATAGIGLVALPCYLGDCMARLERACDTAVAVERPAELWVLTHEDLRRTARVRALTQHLGDELSQLRGRINGDAPGDAEALV